MVRAERGVEPGTEIDVNVWVPTANSGTSCDVSNEPMRQGLRYRINASVFTDEKGQRHVAADQCGGGRVELVRSAYAKSLIDEKSDTSTQGDVVLAAVVGVVVTAALTVALRRRASHA